MTVQPPRRPFTVLVRFTASPADQDELLEMLTAMMMEVGPFLASQPGFLQFRSLRALDGSGVVNLFQWESQADHEACMAQPEMETAAGAIAEWVDAGRVRLDIEPFQLVSSIG